MKKSELLQLAIDTELAMKIGDQIELGKTPYLCTAVFNAACELANRGELESYYTLANELRDIIAASINSAVTYTSFMRHDLNIATVYSNGSPKKFAFIQFMRKKRAEHIIAQLQAIGE